MSDENHQSSFDSLLKIDNVTLNEKLRVWYPTTIEELSEKLSGLLSPIRRVPNEILCQIFLYSCGENDMNNERPAALIISSVCTRFRELAISYPALWSNLKVFFPAGEVYDFDTGEIIQNPLEVLEQETKLSSLIQLHLDRSKNHPLALDLDIAGRVSPPEHPSVQLLTRESSRWKYLVFRGIAFDMDHGRLSFPSLESVDFDRGLVAWRTDTPEEFLLAPNINDLRFHNEIANNRVLKFSDTWKSLVHLKYPTTPSFSSFWRVLELCPMLGSLTLEGWNTGRITIPSHLPRTLPTLSSLTVINNGFDELGDSLQCILSLLTTPNLSELVLEQTNEETVDCPHQPFPHIYQFFERSQLRSLTSLVMHGLYISGHDMVELLLKVPSLKILSIHPDLINGMANPISKSFIESLHAGRRSAFRDSVEPLVPKLRELTLKVTAQRFDPPSFVDTIASRWLPDETSARELGLVCLRSVELHLPGPVDAKPYERLKQFDKAGLRIVVKCEGVDGYIV
ncbi:hypothetical protein BDP27DRAFT_1322624 [Rhodocollybia butyracea]|uniref:F-box domain-containing protein n=1 Tax=Rhodocollybia butyracea TaxID=206335 RepID=A0A9P5PXK9_9AGAR|nr:hypothetical protein BDP27DRAFT_1322624 [Rhodocollybia butyracea]